jgi:4-hydroxy-tetrahydrodipicolinate synthase
MKQLYPLRGIVTVLNTPFCNNNTIAFDALKKNVTKALRAGVAGFLVPAMASEVDKLSTEERIKMVEAVLEITGDRVPVFAGAGDEDIERSRKLLKEYINPFL